MEPRTCIERIKINILYFSPKPTVKTIDIRIPKDIYLILKKAVTRKYLRYCRKLVQKYNCGNANVVNNEDANLYFLTIYTKNKLLELLEKHQTKQGK